VIIIGSKAPSEWSLAIGDGGQAAWPSYWRRLVVQRTRPAVTPWGAPLLVGPMAGLQSSPPPKPGRSHSSSVWCQSKSAQSGQSGLLHYW